jgi:hypothetical protein
MKTLNTQTTQTTQTLESYSNEEYNLTKNEQVFIKVFLSENDCGAKTPEELLEDNFSCQCLEDLEGTFSGLSRNQIGGYLSSLQEKGVLMFEKRQGARANDKNMYTFEPDLYWVEDSYIESLDADLDFYLDVPGARDFF